MRPFWLIDPGFRRTRSYTAVLGKLVAASTKIQQWYRAKKKRVASAILVQGWWRHTRIADIGNSVSSNKTDKGVVTHRTGALKCPIDLQLVKTQDAFWVANTSGALVYNAQNIALYFCSRYVFECPVTKTPIPAARIRVLSEIVRRRNNDLADKLVVSYANAEQLKTAQEESIKISAALAAGVSSTFGDMVTLCIEDAKTIPQFEVAHLLHMLSRKLNDNLYDYASYFPNDCKETLQQIRISLTDRRMLAHDEFGLVLSAILPIVDAHLVLR